MRVILFTNARDEKHIKEWVAHHLNLGFDFIHIFDHESIEPIISQFKKNSKLRIQNITGDTNIKKECMNIAISIAKQKKYEWMIYLDADEFLIINKHTNVKDLLNEYLKFNQVGLNWIFFGSNYLTEDPPGMMLENYIRCNMKINKHIKCFVKPNDIIGIHNAHVYQTTNNKSVSCYNLSPLNNKEPWFVSIPDKNYKEVPAYIAHYINQSYDNYVKRRLKRKRDDSSVLTKKYSENELHTIDNDIINTEVRDKYCEKNAELMKRL
jgi:hypothetical protein